MQVNPILSNQLLFTTSTPTFADLILTDFAGGSETIDEILDDIIPEGILDAFTVNDATGITITWSAGEVWDSASKTVVEVTEEATPQNCTDDAVNYLKWVSGTTLTLGTALPSGTDVLIASINCADGDIWEINQIPIVSDIIGELAVAFQEIFPSLISSGLIVSEHAAGETFDVDMSGGVYFNRIYGREAVSQKDSSIGNDLLTTWYKSAVGEWTATADQSEIDETQWNNGTALAGVGTPYWYRSLFFVTSQGINWVYPTAQYTTKAQAIAAPDPELPAGLTDHPKSTVLILQWNAVALPTAAGDQWIDVRPIIGSTVSGDFSDHGNLAGLGDDDHTQYILHSLADAANDFLVASGADTFVKKTLAETGAILEGDIDHGNLQGLSTGADHSYIDQDVTSGANVTFGTIGCGAITSTGVLSLPDGTAAIPALRFSANLDTGIYKQDTDAIGVSLGGIERVRFDVAAIYAYVPVFDYYRFSNVATLANSFQFKKSKGTIAVPLSVTSGNVLGTLGFYGNAKSHPLISYYAHGGAKIRALANEDFSLNNTGTKLEFWTTPDASGAQALRMTIEASGSVTMAGNLLVDGGDIGITGDTNLLQLAANALIVDGDLTLGTDGGGERTLTAYSDDAGKYFTIESLGAGGVTISAIGVIPMAFYSTTYMNFTAASGATGLMYFNFGQSCAFRDRDDGYAERMSIDAGTGLMKTYDIQPYTDNTHYLGKNDDDTPLAWKGVILKDTTDGKYYRIEVINGTVTATDLTD